MAKTTTKTQTKPQPQKPQHKNVTTIAGKKLLRLVIQLDDNNTNFVAINYIMGALSNMRIAADGHNSVKFESIIINSMTSVSPAE